MSHLSLPWITPLWAGARGDEGHNGRYTPSKRMWCQRWERRWGWCERCGVSGDTFASRESLIHLSMTLTPGAWGKQSACGQDRKTPTATQPLNKLSLRYRESAGLCRQVTQYSPLSRGSLLRCECRTAIGEPDCCDALSSGRLIKSLR